MLGRHTSGPQHPYPRPSHPRHCDVSQNPPDGCISPPPPPVFEIQKKEGRHRTPKIQSTLRMSSRFSIFRKSYCVVSTNEIPAFEDFVTKGRRTHHLARSHTGSKCACGAIIPIMHSDQGTSHCCLCTSIASHPGRRRYLNLFQCRC